MKNQKAIQGSSLKRRLTFRKKAIIVVFALYVTFILLSRIPYLAESQVRSKAEMDDKYVYNLVFPEDGTHTHYYIERWDPSSDGRIELTYWTATHTLNVETTNLKVLTIECKLIYFGESMKVFKTNPYDDPAYYRQYFIDNDEFLINVEANDKINELKFLEFPEPTEVWVNDEKWEEDTDYKFVGNEMQFEEVPQGTTKVVLFFLEKFAPVAKFTMSKSSTQVDKKNVYELNQEVSFDGTTSTDEDGIIEDYEWDFGDGSEPGVDDIVTHKYIELGEFMVILEVTDDHGLTGTVEKTLKIVISTDDLDGDAMPDWWEYKYMPKVNPETPDADEDADDDGLTNLQEYLNNTDPRIIDTDDDTYSDYDEIVKYKTNASNPNSMPEEKKGTGLDELLNYLIIIAIIIIILIFIVLGLLIRKRKKKVEEKERAAPEVEEGEEGEAGPMPGMPPMQIPMLGPGAGVQEMYGEHYPGYTPYPPEPEPMRAPGEREAPPISREEIYKPGVEPEPPLLKAEPKYPYSGIEEDVAHEELASELEGMAIPPEEGIPALEEGLPPEEVPMEEEVPEEEVEVKDDKELESEEKLEEETLEEEEAETKPEEVEEPEEKVEFTVKDYVRLGAIHFKNEEYSDAILEWQKALDVEPDHPEIVASIKEAMTRLKEKK